MLRNQLLKFVFHNYVRPISWPKNKFEELVTKLKTILDKNKFFTTEIALIRDFNFLIINWQNEKINGGIKFEQDRAKLLLDLIDKFNLCQIIDQPTRINNVFKYLYKMLILYI